jgi:N-acetylmuramoyl-L-alanine amidase
MILAMNLIRCVACTSRTTVCVVVFLFLMLPAHSSSSRRWDSQAAEAAFKLAREKRAEISASAKPTLDQYLDCARTYRKVHAKDPHYGRTGDAIYEEGLIYLEAAEKFSNQEYYKTAAARFRLLVKEYGGNVNCPEALIRLGSIYAKQLDDQNAADEAYRSLRSQYRYSAEAIKRLRSESAPAAARTEVVARPEKPELKKPPPQSEALPDTISTVHSLRFWSTNDYTRVLIDMDSDTKYIKERLYNPDRVYFDIANSRISPDLNRDIKLTDGIVKQIRLAVNRDHVVRIVIDTAETGDFSVSEMHDPFRIVVDLRKKGAPPFSAPIQNGPRTLEAPASKPDQAPTAITEIKSSATPENLPAKPIEIPRRPKDKPANSPSGETPSANAEAKPKPPSLADNPAPKPPKPPVPASSDATGIPTKKPADKPGDYVQSTTSAASPSASKSEPAPAITADRAPNNAKTAARKTDPEIKSAGIKEPSPPKPDLIPLPKQAEPTSKGDRTLTRMLGLKVGRIVIDPGHGGHDHGSIGPGGLLEKDLVLSIAQSLRKMIEEKLGAEVFLTREDDTFIPLEERTAIANQHKADLFISIHANSSRIQSISGVETYYLDFAKSDAEREIAARENVTSDNNVRDLENLIKKIAQADKSSESRELASILQKKLYSGARQVIPASHNRGVRSAPFIVLIGANMPSVLAEVSFISNPRDEKMLKKETIRQTLVKSLFAGIDGYMKALGSDTVRNPTVSQTR